MAEPYIWSKLGTQDYPMVNHCVQSEASDWPHQLLHLSFPFCQWLGSTRHSGVGLKIAMIRALVAERAQAFTRAISSHLKRLAGEGVGEVLSRLDEQETGAASVLIPEPTTLPVLNHLDSCLKEASLFDAAISQAIADLRPYLQWRQSKAYNDALLGTGFIENYGWCEVIGPNGLFQGNDFLLGLLMLGPNTHYRDHFHPAPELYWPLTSNTEWRKGDEKLTPKAAGTVIWHQPNVIHATKTGAAPLLTIWSWTRDTATPARLV